MYSYKISNFIKNMHKITKYLLKINKIKSLEKNAKKQDGPTTSLPH